MVSQWCMHGDDLTLYFEPAVACGCTSTKSPLVAKFGRLGIVDDTAAYDHMITGPGLSPAEIACAFGLGRPRSRTQRTSSCELATRLHQITKPPSAGKWRTSGGVTSISITYRPCSRTLRHFRAAMDSPIRDEQDEKRLTASHQPSMSTLAQALPDGCSYGERKLEDGGVERVIWVEFPPDSRDNPFFFSAQRKVLITIVACIFTTMSGGRSFRNNG